MLLVYCVLLYCGMCILLYFRICSVLWFYDTESCLCYLTLYMLYKLVANGCSHLAESYDWY